MFALDQKLTLGAAKKLSALCQKQTGPAEGRRLMRALIMIAVASRTPP
jgi:hypothetical protein